MNANKLYAIGSLLCATLLGLATLLPVPGDVGARMSGGGLALGALAIALCGVMLGFLALRHPGPKVFPLIAIVANSFPLLWLASRLVL